MVMMTWSIPPGIEQVFSTRAYRLHCKLLSERHTQIYLVRKKQKGLSTKTEREGQEVAEEIKYIRT